MSNQSIHAIVLTWNRPDDVAACIASLRQNDVPPTHIHVVDNGSEPSHARALKTVVGESEDIGLIRNENNLGFAAGINIGIRKALDGGATHILLVNDDATLAPECIGLLSEQFSMNHDVVMAGPRIFYEGDRTRIWQGGGRFHHIKSDLTVPEMNRTSTQCPPRTRDEGFLTGCVVLIRGTFLEALGPFDTDFIFYGEDMALCLRALRNGYRLRYVPEAHAFHKITSISADRTSPFVMYHRARSRIILLCKYYGGPYLLYGLLLHFIAFTPFRMLQIFNGSRSPNAAWNWFSGTWAGLWRHNLLPNDVTPSSHEP